VRKVPQTKWGKIERRCFHWSTNTRSYQGRKLLQGDEKAAWDSFKFVVKGFFGKQKGSKLWGACRQTFVELPGIRLQHVTKSTLPSLAFGFFPRELWYSEWRTRRGFLSRHFFNGEEISREVELWYARRLLLDFGKGCPPTVGYTRQAKGKKNKFVNFFVLNNEFTWKKISSWISLC